MKTASSQQVKTMICIEEEKEWKGAVSLEALALNDLTGPSAGPLSRTPFSIPFCCI